MTVPQSGDAGNWWPERGGAPVTVTNQNSGGGQLMTGIGLITSISALNTNASTPARFTLHDGTDGSGPVIVTIGAAASQPFSLGAGDGGIYFGTGLYLQQNNGTMVIVVTYIPLTLPLK